MKSPPGTIPGGLFKEGLLLLVRGWRESLRGRRGHFLAIKVPASLSRSILYHSIFAIASAAVLPAPIARMTVAAPVTASPPA